MENQENNLVQSPAAEGQKPVARKGQRRDARNGEKRQGGRRENTRRDSRPEKLYEERVVSIKRNSKTVTGGRGRRISTVVVIGVGEGKYGYGAAKSTEVPEAINKALEAAKVNMYRLPIVKAGTIPHVV